MTREQLEQALDTWTMNVRREALRLHEAGADDNDLIPLALQIAASYQKKTARALVSPVTLGPRRN